MNSLISHLLPVESGLLASGRVPSLSRSATSVRVAEWTALALCGIAAAVAANLHDPITGVPGHAIWRAILPILCGLSLVPRRGSGTLMSLFGLPVVLLLPGNLGRGGFGNVTSMLALGPALDVAMLHAGTGWRIYVRAIAAGVAANLPAWGARTIASTLGWDRGLGSGNWSYKLGSYMICGALAGLIGALIWFRVSPRQLPRATAISGDGGTASNDP